MKRTQYVLFLIVALSVMGYFFVHTYLVSPGFTTEEQAQEFYASVPECVGIEFVLFDSRDIDAGVRNVCIGLLR